MILVEMSPDDACTLARQLKEKLGLSQEAFARLLNVSLRTVSRWLTQKDQNPDPATRERLQRLSVVVDRLLVSRRPAEVVKFLTTPNREFEYCPPLDLIGSQFATRALLAQLQ